jgi:hypothetical protein
VNVPEGAVNFRMKRGGFTSISSATKIHPSNAVMRQLIQSKLSWNISDEETLLWMNRRSWLASRSRISGDNNLSPTAQTRYQAVPASGLESTANSGCAIPKENYT